jgi:hypothetical protein
MLAQIRAGRGAPMCVCCVSSGHLLPVLWQGKVNIGGQHQLQEPWLMFVHVDKQERCTDEKTKLR